MQSIVLVGIISKISEIKNSANNKKMITFVVADNGMKGQTTFFNCIAWEKNAETINKYCSKGDILALKLKYTSNTYTAKDGQKNTVNQFLVETITFCSKTEKKQNEEQPVEEESMLDFFNNQNKKETQGVEIFDDDLPF